MKEMIICCVSMMLMMVMLVKSGQSYVLVVSDSFNRADEDPLSSVNWTAPSTYCPIGLKIVSQEVQAKQPSGGINCMYWSNTSVSFGNDQWANITILDVTRYPGLLIRYNETDLYAFYARDNYRLRVSRYDGGAWNLINTTSTTTFYNGDVFRAEANNTDMIYYINESERGRFTDSGISSGRPGLYAYTSGGVGVLDNFQAGNVSDAPTGGGSLGFNWSLNSTSSTTAGTDITHSVYWQTNSTSLSGYIFSWYNGSNWTDGSCGGYSIQSDCQQYGCSWSAYTNATMKHSANEGLTSKIGTGYTNATVLSLSASDLAYNTKWFIWSYGELSGNGTAVQVLANFYIGGTNYLYVADRPATANTEYMPFSQAAIINGTGAALNAYLQVAGSSTAQNGTMRRARIGALRLDNLPSTEYNYTFDGTGATNMDNVWGDDATDTRTITITPATPGYYYIYGGASVNSDIVTGLMHTRININNGEQYYPILSPGSNYNYTGVADGNTAEEVAFSHGFIKWFNSSQTHTIKYQFADGDATASADWDDLSLLAFRVSDVFPGFTNVSDTTISSTQSTTFQNKTILSLTGGDWLYL